MTLTRSQVEKILNAHGFGFDTPTACDRDRNYDPSSTFDCEMGVKDEYVKRDVFQWLGY